MGTSWEGRRNGDVGIDLLADLADFFDVRLDATGALPSSPLESSPRDVVAALEMSVVSWELALRVDTSSHGVGVVESSRVVTLAH